FYYNHVEKKSFKQKNLAGENINCIAECPETGHLLIGTTEGFSKVMVPGDQPINLHIENGLIDENISSIWCEGPENIWIGSANGLLKYNGKAFDFYNLYNDNNANHIRCLLKDSEENIWVGTHSGIYRYRDNAFSSFDKSTGIGNAFVYKILKDKEGNIWFCTDGSGIYKYAQGFFKNYTTKDGLLDNSCNSATLMEDGSIWFGTNSGISVFRNNRFEKINSSLQLKVKGVLTVQYKDSKGSLWVGGQNGAEAIQKQNGIYKTSFYKIPELLKESGVQSIVEDKNGNIWLGTFLGGIFKLENNEFVYQNKKLNIKAESFFTLLVDKHNVMFGATLNGVWIYDLNKGTQQYITDKDGLNSELIYSLHLSDNENILWVGTNQGINKFDLKKFRESGNIYIQSFGKTEGFTGVECNNYGVMEEEDGTLWFGTVSGVVRHNPKSIKTNSKIPDTYIQNIKLLSEDTLLANGSILPYNYNNITFYYRGICYTNPEKVRYMKMLEGYETSWSEPSPEDYSKYANLPAGKYTFKVKSCNNEGIWSEEPASFSFEILLPFYKTWWFISLLVISISSLIIIVFRVRLQNIRKKQREEFEKKVEISKV
ncbi:MAG TPA: two-component regulator propeller domain-containing protein, partial [Bacteroidia bacterium]|nr:two-component regulator propeller domain-containing protein [Bacteroidia bacterium]